MKRLLRYYFISIILLLCSWKSICYADPVDSVVAKTVAFNFFSTRSSTQIVDFRLAYTEKGNDNIPVYYVFNVNEEDGFVIVSGDDAVRPILGYSFNRYYRTTNVSPEFACWMSCYKEQILLIRDKKIKSTNKTNLEWGFYENSSLSSRSSNNANNTIIVSPLLNQIEWNQSGSANLTLYNNMCPGAPPNQTVTGCVATAMGQIMKYWNYPAHGSGVTSPYTTNQTPSYNIPSIDLGAVTYDWSNIPDKLGVNSTNTEINEIAQLLYHCGVSIRTQYGTESSAGFLSFFGSTTPETALPNHFGYNSSTIIGRDRSFYPDFIWKAGLKNELDNNRPVLYRGQDAAGHGHVWVCDGYTEDDYFHMNWGWGGWYNNYFSLDLLSPVMGYDYSISQQMIIGIQPDCQIADLIITNKSVNNNSPSPGGSVTVFCREKNEGHISAGANTIKLYLSNSATLNLSSTIYLGQISVGSVSALNQTSLLSTSITIPTNSTSGQYWLFYYADANEEINECYENNNFASVILNISSGTCSPPQNDECMGVYYATQLNFSISCLPIPSTSCGATASGFNACSGNADDDVFFRFTPTASNVTIRVASSSGYDAVFQLLTGPCGTSMQSVGAGCINNTGSGGVETQSYSGLITGNIYFIRVWHAGSGWGSGNFSICVYGNACSTPGVANPLSPGNPLLPGQIINTTTPQFSWSNATGATRYVVRVSREPYGFNNIVYTSACTSSSIIIPAGILQNGSNYRWDVEALYNCGSSCNSLSGNYYFTVNTAPCTVPATQASNIIFAIVGSDQMNIGWTNGSGNRRVVKINTINSFTAPVNGSSIPANSNYAGSGEQTIYDGSGGSVLVTGLFPGGNYCFRVYEANCSGTLSMYNTSSETNNPLCQTTTTSSCITPSIPASNISFTNAGTTSLTVNWAAGNGNRRLVKINTSNSFTAPADGIDYTANSIYSGSGEQVVYNGTGNSITITGLSVATNYCFRVYEAKCSGAQSLYNINTATNNPNCELTVSSCIAPSDPIPVIGDITCPGVGINLNGVLLKWTKSGSSRYDIEIRQYPYGSSNIVHTQYCIADTSVTVNNINIVAGKLYSWKVRATTDCYTCSSSWSQNYYFHKPPSISPTGEIFVCNGSGITLTTPVITVPAPAVVNYQWYKNNNGSPQAVGANSNTYFVSSSDTYYVKLIYTGAVICTGNDTTNASPYNAINIGYIPPAPALASNSPVQLGSDLSLSATTSLPGSNIFFWSGPDGFASSNANNTISSISPNEAGTYSCYLINNGCESEAATVNVYVIPIGHNTYRYWVDRDFTNAVAADAGSNTPFTLQLNIPASQLSNGLHTLHVQFMSNNKWSSVVSGFFYKPIEVSSAASEYEYWLDNNYSNKTIVNTPGTANFILLDSLNLSTASTGLHSLHFRFRPDGKKWSSTVSSFFYKSDAAPAGTAQYEYWFDTDYINKTLLNNIIANNFILLDNIITNNLDNGLHALHFRFRPDGKTWSSITSNFFYKDNDAITGINNLARYVYWYDYNWQDPKAIIITGVQDINWTLNTNAEELSGGPHTLSQAFKDDRGKWSSIVSSNFTKEPVTSPLCQFTNRQFLSGVIGGGNSSYQWQVDNGSGFVDITTGAVYSGVTTDTLHFSNVPTSWYGYKYRCLVTTGSNTIIGDTSVLRFAMIWNGSTDNAWENPANWNCNATPDANTDVYINAGLARYPQVNTNVFCRKLLLQPGSSLEVNAGNKLEITGKD